MKLADLRAMSDDDLIKEHDKLDFYEYQQSEYRDELLRRQQERNTKTMKCLTIVITILTAIVTAATIVNVWAALKTTGILTY